MIRILLTLWLMLLGSFYIFLPERTEEISTVAGGTLIAVIFALLFTDLLE